MEPRGTELNFDTLIPKKVTELGKEKNTDPSSVAGGGLATDGIKPTLVGTFHDGDVRESAKKGSV